MDDERLEHGERCPECGAVLERKVGFDPERGDFEGIRCPDGCDLR